MKYVHKEIDSRTISLIFDKYLAEVWSLGFTVYKVKLDTRNGLEPNSNKPFRESMQIINQSRAI